MTSRTALKPPSTALPPVLADVALIDAATCAAAGSVSVSWWHERVRIGAAPQPAVRMSRFTRWNAAAVSEFWKNFATSSDATASEKLMATTKKASDAAQVKRRAKAA